MQKLIRVNAKTIFEKDYDGRTALDIAISKGISNAIVVSMIEVCLPVDPETKMVRELLFIQYTSGNQGH
jgi:hypothetical protein